MNITHDTLVALSKSWGLFYLIALSVGVLVYAYRPANRRRFTDAKTGVLDTEDRPWS